MRGNPGNHISLGDRTLARLPPDTDKNKLRPSSLPPPHLMENRWLVIFCNLLFRSSLVLTRCSLRSKIARHNAQRRKAHGYEFIDSDPSGLTNR